MIFGFIEEHRTEWSVLEMCHVLSVSRSGFYSWLSRPPSRRQIENMRLDVGIKVIWEQSRRLYGSTKIAAQLSRYGWKIGKNRVAYRMKLAGIKSFARLKYKLPIKSVKLPTMIPNILDSNFKVSSKNKAWVYDITYRHVRNGWRYLAIILDLFSRKIVGWALSKTLGKDIVIQALKRAINYRQPRQNLIIHSDIGSQYLSSKFKEILYQQKIIQSMSRKGNCWDSAPAESFFATLKAELIYKKQFKTTKELFRALFEYIEIFYIGKRIHLILNYLTPNKYKKRAIL